MIVTFTANPSVDRTTEVGSLVRGSVMRAHAVRVDAGGKGVNVTRALARNGHPSVAVLPSGGAEGAQLRALLAAERFLVRAVLIGGAVRSNVTIIEPDGTTTKVNEPGPMLSASEVEALSDALLSSARGADWAVLAGSLPPGAPRDLYAQLTRALHRLGVRVAVDAGGALLREALVAGPDLIKPNRRELSDAAEVPVAGVGDASAASSRLRRLGARSVLASLGPDGALLVDDDGSFHAVAPVAVPRSTVGAGDALLAGFLVAGGHGASALAEGVAWGSAAVALPGSQMPGPADLDRAAVQVEQLDVLRVAS
jgi:1-phosphofructokinase